MTTAVLAEIALPDFGASVEAPMIPVATYQARIDAAVARSRALGHDVLIVYGDREHSANLVYLTGFDPRFEEAMLVLAPDRTPALFVGNEDWGYADISPVPLRKVLYQTFSLMAQPRDRSKPLAALLREEGIGAGKSVGVVGWKYFDEKDAPSPTPAAQWLEVPAYLVDTLRGLVGDPALVVNAGAIFMNAEDGLRVINDVDQLAVFEYAACHTSSAVKNVLFGLKPGLTEYEAAQLLGLKGMAQSCHLMLASGRSARVGLGSPSGRVIERGDPFTTAFGVWGALNCRAGFVVADASELPADIADYVDKLVAPYFRAIAEWYMAIGIGVTGGTLFEIIDRHLGDPFFGIFLNPGHQIHLDEWVNSPIEAGSSIALRSGMAFQSDVIPATGTAYFTTNIEDGFALADAALRDAFAACYPEAWARVEARRAFMKDALGIALKPEVMPFSNIPAYLAPFLLRPDRAMKLVG